MSKAIENLEAAQRRAMAIRPKVGGFPYLAEALREAGVTRNLWFLPACQSLYLTKDGPVVTLGAPLLAGGAISTGAVAAEATVRWPALLVAVTESRSVWPMSAAVGV